MNSIPDDFHSTPNLQPWIKRFKKIFTTSRKKVKFNYNFLCGVKTKCKDKNLQRQ